MPVLPCNGLRPGVEPPNPAKKPLSLNLTSVVFSSGAYRSGIMSVPGSSASVPPSTSSVFAFA